MSLLSSSAEVARRRLPLRLPRQDPLSAYLAAGRGITPALWLALLLMVVAELAWLFSTQAPARSGLEQWLLWWMSIHASGFFPALSLLAAAGLIVWQRKSGELFALQPGLMAGLLLESGLLGLVLAMLVKALRLLAFGPAFDIELHSSWWSSFAAAWPMIPGSIAAAVHEEVLFRWLALGGVLWLTRSWNRRWPVIRAVWLVVISFLFAGLHYSLLNPEGGPPEWTGLLCYFGLGLVFGGLYLGRGLAIAMGVHAAYNVFVLL